jgi:hypothetical protein
MDGIVGFHSGKEKYSIPGSWLLARSGSGLFSDQPFKVFDLSKEDIEDKSKAVSWILGYYSALTQTR